jgi:hypothetical protein
MDEPEQSVGFIRDTRREKQLICPAIIRGATSKS